jgi:polyphosphate kinase 2 (PPK2 family)
MFESAELEHTISKQRYKEEEPALREALLEAQYDRMEARSFPVIIVVGGGDGGGKGETMNVLHA